MDQRATILQWIRILLGCAAGSVPLLATVGCVGSGHASYPEGWAPASRPASTAQLDQKEPRHACPDLAGRYQNVGQLAPSTPQELCGFPGDRTRSIGDWDCETSLGQNIGAIEPIGSWIELRQPDSDTLLVVPGDPTLDPLVLRRSKGDFDCTADGLVRLLRAPMMSPGDETGKESTFAKSFRAFSAVELAFVATGGVQTLKRTFSRSQDGSLIMHVERSTHGLMAALPVDQEYSTFVHWAVDTSVDGTGDTQAPAP